MAEECISGGVVILQPIKFQCGVFISTGLPCIYIYSSSYVYLNPTRAKFDLHRTFMNVTAAEVGRCLSRILPLEHCNPKSYFRHEYAGYCNRIKVNEGTKRHALSKEVRPSITRGRKFRHITFSEKCFLA
jgi:hypothetical protein